MSQKSAFFTPLMRQIVVAAGIALNVIQSGLVVGFTSSLLPQLRASDSPISIDDNTGSWIAAIPAITLLPSNIIFPIISGKYGRKYACVISIIPVITGWLLISCSETFTSLLIGRCLQGLSLAIAICLGPVIIGEYSSPKYRGPFLMSVILARAIGTHLVHTLGSLFHWKVTALICAIFAFINLMIVLHFPESPSWLIDQGRFDEGRKVFHWLRGDAEEDELNKLIESNKDRTYSKDVGIIDGMKSNLIMLQKAIKEPEFVKPIIIMFHLYSLSQWTGVNILGSYAVDIFHNVIGDDANVDLMILTVDTQRVITNSVATYVVKKIKRKKMLFLTVSLNVISLLAISSYTFLKKNYTLPFDSPFIGVLLLHLQVFSIAFGSVPIPNVIAGEIFPLKYRSLASGISCFVVSPMYFIAVKTVPYLFSTVGIHGAYFIYACIIVYCLVLTLTLLPETKDKTLQDIEEEFSGRRKGIEEVEKILTAVK